MIRSTKVEGMWCRGTELIKLKGAQDIGGKVKVRTSTSGLWTSCFLRAR